jgi:hypothetical protein
MTGVRTDPMRFLSLPRDCRCRLRHLPGRLLVPADRAEAVGAADRSRSRRRRTTTVDGSCDCLTTFRCDAINNAYRPARPPPESTGCAAEPSPPHTPRPWRHRHSRGCHPVTAGGRRSPTRSPASGHLHTAASAPPRPLPGPEVAPHERSPVQRTAAPARLAAPPRMHRGVDPAISGNRRPAISGVTCRSAPWQCHHPARRVPPRLKCR